MKRVLIVALLSVFVLNLSSCKKEKEGNVEKSKVVNKYVIDSKTTVVHWTAYKTTDKVPVKGIFKQVEISNVTSASNPVEVIKNVKFIIPVNSIFSNDSIRDFKLTTFLFGKMTKTSHIIGKASLQDNGKGEASITMNGFTKKVSLIYEVHGNDMKIMAKIDLNNWKAQAAVAALNEVCSEKHKAADGKSVTWSEVDIMVELKTVIQK